MVDLAEIEAYSSMHIWLQALRVCWWGLVGVVKIFDSEGISFFCFFTVSTKLVFIDLASFLFPKVEWAAQTVPSPKSVGVKAFRGLDCLSKSMLWNRS